MANSNPITLERIDHGVLPSNDLGRAFRFWSTFMGGQIGHHTNLNARGLNREVPMIIFMTVANHRGFGLALQDFRISPNPARGPEDLSIKAWYKTPNISFGSKPDGPFWL